MKFLCLLFIASSLTLFSQDFLDMKDGRQIEYLNIKINGDEVTVKTTDRKKLTFNQKEIKGKYNKRTQEYFYNVPIEKELTLTLVDAFKTPSSFDFLERKCEGAINLYERVTTSMSGTAPGPGGVPMSTTSKDTDLFVEQNGRFTEIQFTGLLPAKKLERIEFLKGIVKDSPEALIFLNAPDFKLNYDNVLDLIQIFNVSKFKRPITANKNPSSVFFYSKVKKEGGPKLTLIVNDSLKKELPHNAMASIIVDIKNQNKVCVTSGEISTCEVIFGSPHFIKYYQVEFNEAKGVLNIESSSLIEGQRYISYMQANKK